MQVTIVPRERWPLGQTVVRVNEQRERTNLFTREYLEQQLRTVLAGKALPFLHVCAQSNYLIVITETEAQKDCRCDLVWWFSSVKA